MDLYDNPDSRSIVATFELPGVKIEDTSITVNQGILVIQGQRLYTTNIDCTGKIISPGFIDTHHHVWQTQLKGRHANDLLLEYMCKGRILGELGGCLEAVDGGTTTVVDHAHINHSAEHSSSALSATVASGIRSYFCYCPVPQNRAASWAPFRFEQGSMAVPEWTTNQLAELAASQHFGDGRVRLGVAFDAWYLQKDIIISLFQTARALGVKLFTSHCGRNALQGQHSLVNMMDAYGLLKDDILLSHASQALPEDAVKLVAEHAHISTTPDTEMQMGAGTPVCFRPDLHGISSLGIDCHSNNSADILSQMRLALQNARSLHNQQFIAQGKLPRTVNATVEEAFNLGTIMGARASPSMICAAEHDPVAAIVLCASVRDIETVIVDGRIRKHGGNFLPVEVDVSVAKGPVEWPQVAAKLLNSRQQLREKLKTADMDGAKKVMIELFHIDEHNIVDHL
ncbi:hypothetical protein B0H19DRAFT_1327052 [Mycena capillaripes]|nr:hypothetical protein B0H19DRAFT_1327052 [Mycena capillaripes]